MGRIVWHLLCPLPSVLTCELVNGLFDFICGPSVPVMGSICPLWFTEFQPGSGWDYSDSEILDTRPSVSLCQPFPLYQIGIFTNSDLRPSFRNLFLLVFLIFGVFKSRVSDVYPWILSQQGVHLSSHYALLWVPNCLLTASLGADGARDGGGKIWISQENLHKHRPPAHKDITNMYLAKQWTLQ